MIEINETQPGLLHQPPTPKNPPKSNTEHLRREFHNLVGHSTDDCIHLRNQIEDLILSGAWRKYVSGMSAFDNPPPPPAQQGPVRNHLNFNRTREWDPQSRNQPR